MLILTRNIGESIIISDDVKIKGESHGQIKIGIDALHDEPVHREEIYNRIHEEHSKMSHDPP